MWSDTDSVTLIFGVHLQPELIVSISSGLNLCVVASLQKPPHLKHSFVHHQLVLLTLGFRCLSLHHVTTLRVGM